MYYTDMSEAFEIWKTEELRWHKTMKWIKFAKSKREMVAFTLILWYSATTECAILLNRICKPDFPVCC
jgi:hypothetical protein